MNSLLRNKIYREVRDIFVKYELSMKEKHTIIEDLVTGHHIRIDLEKIRDEVRSIHHKNREDIKRMEKARDEGRIPDN